MKEANNLFVKIKMENENALKVGVKIFCCVSNSIRHVSRYSLTSFCN